MTLTKSTAFFLSLFFANTLCLLTRTSHGQPSGNNTAITCEGKYKIIENFSAVSGAVDLEKSIAEKKCKDQVAEFTCKGAIEVAKEEISNDGGPCKDNTRCRLLRWEPNHGNTCSTASSSDVQSELTRSGCGYGNNWALACDLMMEAFGTPYENPEVRAKACREHQAEWNDQCFAHCRGKLPFVLVKSICEPNP